MVVFTEACFVFYNNVILIISNILAVLKLVMAFAHQRFKTFSSSRYQ